MNRIDTISAPAYSLIRPASLWMEIPLLLSFNLLLVGLAQLAIQLPFSPVPITGQTLGVMLIAMALGRVRGTAVVTAYLLEGAAGLPVFASGTGGVAILFGPTGGYLLGFVASAWVVGSLADRGWDRNLLKSTLAMTFGTALIIVSGLAWLSRFVETDILLSVGFTPFVSGAVVKIMVAAVMLPAVWKFVGRKRK